MSKFKGILNIEQGILNFESLKKQRTTNVQITHANTSILDIPCSLFDIPFLFRPNRVQIFD